MFGHNHQLRTVRFWFRRQNHMNLREKIRERPARLVTSCCGCLGFRFRFFFLSSWSGVGPERGNEGVMSGGG